MLAGALFGIADATLDRWERPEYVVFAAWAGSEVTIAIAVALSGGPSVATLQRWRLATFSTVRRTHKSFRIFATAFPAARCRGLICLLPKSGNW